MSNAVIETNYESPFFTIPRAIFNLPGITVSFIKVYETIFQFWHRDKPCFLSDDALVERTGVSRSQVYEAISFFERCHKLIRRKINGRRYFVQPELKIEDCTQENPTSAPPDEHIRPSGCSTSGGAEHNKNNINNNNLINPYGDFGKSPGRVKKKNYRDDDQFMRFYSEYPNKQKPECAYKAFLKLKPSDDDVTFLINDVKNRMEMNWQNRDKSKIPYPATYLNSKEWESELYCTSTSRSDAPKSMTVEELWSALNAGN